MQTRLTYTYEELLAERPYATRVRHKDLLFHGGLDADGTYIPPRSRYRPDAIAAWTAALVDAGHPTQVITPAQVQRDAFFPNVAQSTLLLHNGLTGAMTRILTLIGVTEGFGNDGLKLMPTFDLQPFFVESISGTCLDHLRRGLFEAHGNDEAGRGDEAGHDQMWYAIRDMALDHPPVTPDMFEHLPIAPPPGYTGPARPAPDAIGVRQMAPTFPALDPLLEVMLTAMAQILVIELVAYTTFAWARDVLSDPRCSAAPERAPQIVEYIRSDENIHVSYLQCALAEARCRTFIDQQGAHLSGAEVIDTLCQKARTNMLNDARRQRILRYRMRHIHADLATRPDGAQLLADFTAAGPVPAIENPGAVR